MVLVILFTLEFLVYVAIQIAFPLKHM